MFKFKNKKIILVFFLLVFYLGFLYFKQNKLANYSFEKFTQEFIPLKLKENIANPDQDIYDPKMHETKTLIKLPEPYLQAGSFHPELYPHDASYSISAIIRLVRAGNLSEEYLELVKSMLNDFSFMVERYGYVLNGNRTYYLTRSQANTITTNVLEYYEFSKDYKWLTETGLRLAEKVFNYWTQEEARAKIFPHSLFKWIAHGHGPCKEVLASNKEHNFYYDKVLSNIVAYAYSVKQNQPGFAQGFDYGKLLENCDLLNMETKNNCKLSDFYYQSDRASRVSGYDTNHLYGPFNSFTLEFVPVDHNAKLYRAANDLAQMFQIIGEADKVAYYRKQAEEIKKSMFEILWDEELGMFFDYHLNGTGLRTNYASAGSGYAIWARLFDIENKNELEKLMRLVTFLEQELEGPNGLYASNIETGMHWDKPYTWPIQQGMIAEGLIYYANLLEPKDPEKANNLDAFAKRIAKKYIEANYRDWKRSKGKNIKEKIVGQKTENLVTGYAVAENYSWNLLGVLDLLVYAPNTR